MPHYTYSRGARRKKLFTRISSTFINNKSGLASSIAKPDSMLHSKSTYFYRWSSSHKLSSKLSYVVPSMCGLALLVGGIIIANPILSNHNQVYAYTVGGGDVGTETTTSTIALSITGNENINSDGSTTVKPGEVAYRSYIFNVSGTAPQYALTLSAANGYTGELKGKDHPDAVIGKVAPSTIPDNFRNNTWGYAMTARNAQTTASSSLTYNPVPTSNSEAPALLTYRSGMTSEYTDTYKLAFAAKLGPDNPSDHYQTQVYLSAVSDSKEITELGFFDKSGNRIANMQDMTSTFCGNVNVGTEGRLQDTRDGKYYYVAKLKDNNCWMTQNLDYDGGGAKIQDITMWDNKTDEGHVASTVAAYYDAGEYVYNGSNGNHAQTAACAGNIIGLLNCMTNNQFSEVTPNSDLHYHVGNYYSWTAATSGVCPNGWILPTSGSNTGQGSFVYLLTQYGIQSSLTSGNYAIYKTPLYFVYGGYLASGQLKDAGNFGYYWSSTSNGSTAAYHLRFADGVYPSAYQTNGRYSGNSIRCIVQ